MKGDIPLLKPVRHRKVTPTRTFATCDRRYRSCDIATPSRLAERTNLKEQMPNEDRRTSTELAVEKAYWTLLDTELPVTATQSDDPRKLTCPAASPEDATDTFGFLETDEGRVVFYAKLIPLPGVLKDDRDTSSPLDRMRLSAPCLTRKCVHWTGESCRLGHAVAEVGNDTDSGEPACAIRPHCRWFAENGGGACKSCAFIHRIPFMQQGRLVEKLGLENMSLDDWQQTSNFDLS